MYTLRIVTLCNSAGRSDVALRCRSVPGDPERELAQSDGGAGRVALCCHHPAGRRHRRPRRPLASVQRYAMSSLNHSLLIHSLLLFSFFIWTRLDALGLIVFLIAFAINSIHLPLEPVLKFSQ